MPSSHELLVAFDTSSDRRRRKITRVLSRYGLRVQRSVFRLWVSRAQVQALQDALLRICLPDEDLLLITEVKAGGWWEFGSASGGRESELLLV